MKLLITKDTITVNGDSAVPVVDRPCYEEGKKTIGLKLGMYEKKFTNEIDLYPELLLIKQ